MKSKTLVVIVGPTAIGKTSLSVALAKKLNTEIISADSRQFFKEMSIGTAKPTLEEMDGIKHHFIDSISIKDEYNAGMFERDALLKIEELFSKKDILILVGGSGLYVDAVCKGFDDIPSRDNAIRIKLEETLLNKGIEALQKQLLELDPSHYHASDINNTQRIIRALEVCLTTGKTYSSYRKNTVKQRPFSIVKIGLTADREIIYNRINQRVDKMINEGLVEEVKNLYPLKKLNALQTVGYTEIVDYLDKKTDLPEAIELIKRNTRRFAKRQLTWFRKDENTTWFDIKNSNQLLEQIIEFINSESFN